MAGTRVAACLVAAASALATACGGDGGSGEMRLVLADDGCAYEGDATAAGNFTVDVENQTALQGAFALAELSEGGTIEDLEGYLEEERERWEQTQQLRGPPPFYSQIVRVAVSPGATSELPADVAAGTYVLMCVNDEPPDWRAYLATRLDVTG